jgi:NTE family protein
METGLVLGGGGLVGMGYHAGVMKALDEFGVDPGSADLIVGTSAGAVIGSYLATGWTPSDFFDYGMGKHPRAPKDTDEAQEVRDIFVPLWHNRGERVRRGIGSLFAAASSRGYYRGGGRGRMPGSWLRHAFPAGLYSTDRTRERLYEDLPVEWPEKTLYLSTAELYSGKRVVFGMPGAPQAPLPDAVLASTAIPGVFPPVKIGGSNYVDGGIVSGTSVDVAADAGCKTILCVAPLGYLVDEPTLIRDPKLWSPMFVRALFARTLRREVTAARAAGIDVFVLRPHLTELKTHGTNSMRHFDRKSVLEGARVSTLRVLQEKGDHPAVVALMRQKEKSRRWPHRSTG